LKRIEVLPGEKFGRLTVRRVIEGNPRKLECICECGNNFTADFNRVRCKKTKSCGCLRRELTIAKNTTHGLSANTEYGIWCGIRKRLFNPNCKSYKDYGGRGINLCDRWNDFSLFLKDVGHRPSDNMTIERIDVNGHYDPGNVKWASRAEQNRNTRNNTFVVIGGISKCVSEWDSIFQKKYAIKPQSFKSRYYKIGEKKAILWVKSLNEQLDIFGTQTEIIFPQES
jgi:hypothetical protein